MNNGTMTLATNGNKIALSAKTDDRIASVDADFAAVTCKTEKAAKEIASELRAWGFARFEQCGKMICW